MSPIDSEANQKNIIIALTNLWYASPVAKVSEDMSLMDCFLRIDLIVGWVEMILCYWTKGKNGKIILIMANLP